MSSALVCGLGPGGWVCGALLMFSLCGGVGGELCYVDSNTGNGVYCEPNCCGSNPTYCCDKDTFIIESAVFGSLGCIFIICMVVCCVCKKRKRNQKKAALKAAAEAKAKAASAPKPPAISVLSSAAATGGGGGGGGGGEGGGCVNQGFSANESAVDGKPSNLTSQQNRSPPPNQAIPLQEMHAASSSSAPSYKGDASQQASARSPGSLHSREGLPPPATTSLPEITYVSESPKSQKRETTVKES